MGSFYSSISRVLKSPTFYLVSAVLIGICLRLYGLDIQGIWFDESASTRIASSHTFKIFIQRFLSDDHPPLHGLFLYFWVKIFGNSEASLRMPSALAGILTLFPMYFLTKKVFNEYTAVSATVLTALSCAAIAYSQEIRPYSFLVLFTTLSTLLWLNIIKDIDKDIKWKNLGFFGLACLGAMFTHYFGLLLVFCQLIYLFFTVFSLKNDNNIRKVFALSFIIAIAYVPWLYVFTHYTRGMPNLIQWLQKPSLDSVINIVNFIFNKKLIILLLLPILLKIKNIKQDSLLCALLHLIILPCVIVFLMAECSIYLNYFFQRYLIIIVPSAYLLIAMLLSQSLKGVKSNIFVFALSLLSLTLFLFVPGNNFWNDKYTYYGPYKQQWREAQKYVSDNYKPGSIILVDRDPSYYSYYFDRFNKTGSKYNIKEYFDPSGVNTDLKELKGIKRAFILTDFTEIPPETVKKIESQHMKCMTKSFTWINVYDCKTEESQPHK